MKPTIDVIIRDQDKIILQTAAKALGSTNEKGPFDIIPKHEHFISVIRNYIYIYHTNGQRQELQINKGIISVWEDKVFIYLNLN